MSNTGEKDKVKDTVTTVPPPVVEDPVLSDKEQSYAMSKPTIPDVPSKADELMAKMFPMKVPNAVLDQAKLDRIKKMGKLNTLGQGIGVLGNILSAGLGGRVARADEDKMTPYLMQQYQATLDKYKDQQSNVDLLNFQNEKENYRFGIGYEKEKERDAKTDELNFAKRQFATSQAENKALHTKIGEEQQQKKIDNTQANQKANADLRKETNRIAEIRAKADLIRSGKTGSKDSVIFQTKSGVNYEMPKKNMSVLRGEMMKGENFARMQKEFPEMITPKMTSDGFAQIKGQWNVSSKLKDEDWARVYQEILEEKATKASAPASVPSTASAPSTASTIAPSNAPTKATLLVH